MAPTAATQHPDRPTVLHLVGSAMSAFYHDLSLVYAREALLPASMDYRFAVVLPSIHGGADAEAAQRAAGPRSE